VTALAQSGNPDYHDEIVQIGFNAWHYADSNLWASLGDEIFRQLAGPGATAQQRREQLREELAAKLGQRRQLDTVTRQAQRTTAELKARVEQAAENRQTATRDLLAAMRNSAELKARLTKLWQRLGIDDDADQAKLLAKQLHGDLTDVEVLRRAPKDRYGKVALTAAAIIVVGIGIAVLVLPALTKWLAGIGGVLALVSAVLGSTWVSHARQGVRGLRALTEDLHTGMVKAADDRLAPQLKKLRHAEAAQQVAEAQLAEVVSQVGELGRQLAELAPGQRLYAFLAERSYDLGLVSTIRKDFEQLVALMDDWRRHPQPDDCGRTPIDRIVLYIDDLDRCGPKQVVEVLQAVHLILALELFVVVVGVDPRWLLRALCSHYTDILDTEELADGWRVTPEDYLEKIINIPLVLPSLPGGSLSRLLRSMIDDEPSPAAEPIRTVSAPAPIPAEPLPDVVPVEAGSEVDSQRENVHVLPHPLTDSELALLERLDLLVDTPREAKRLFNLYRMVRATRDLSEKSTFLGEGDQPGEYQAVVLLLGMITADSRLATVAFDAPVGTDVRGGLARRKSSTAWSEFVADLEPREGLSRIAGPVTDERPWQRLHSGLMVASEQVSLSDVAVFQLWIPRIRRFSYVINGTGRR
jgi:hypothetical protein